MVAATWAIWGRSSHGTKALFDSGRKGIHWRTYGGKLRGLKPTKTPAISICYSVSPGSD
jgi:hypothetical protein